jgi:hypothetical protein
MTDVDISPSTRCEGPHERGALSNLDPEIRLRIREFVAMLLDIARDRGRFPRVGEFVAASGCDLSEIVTASKAGVLCCVQRPSAWADDSQRVIALTRNALRLLDTPESLATLAVGESLNEALRCEYRTRMHPAWISDDELAAIVGTCVRHIAAPLVVLLADELRGYARRLDPFRGCPADLWLDSEFASMTADWSVGTWEPLTLAQEHATVPAGDASAAPACQDLPAERRGRGRGGRLSTAELLRPHEAEFRRRWVAREFASRRVAVAALQPLVNREGARELQAGEPGYKSENDIRLRTRGWFPRPD